MENIWDINSLSNAGNIILSLNTVILREETLFKRDKIFRIIVICTGKEFIVSGYLNGNVINETSLKLSLDNADMAPYSPEIDNLVFLIRDDIMENEFE
ncbi:MAG: hypothetical protein WCK13_09425 [Ignavibacteriota bacterium]|nr:hypothetical protein [Ignavibacteriota bacterium]